MSHSKTILDFLGRSEKEVIYAILTGDIEAKKSEKYREGHGAGISLIEDMLQAYHMSGYLIAIIVGVQGSGKSLYAFHTARLFLKELGLLKGSTLVDQLKYVLNNYTVFLATNRDKKKAIEYFEREGIYDSVRVVEKFPTLEEKIKSARWYNAWPVLIWDDAGIFGSAYKFFFDKRFTHKLSSIFQVIRRRVKVMLITTPHPDFVLTFIRKTPERRILVVEPSHDWYSSIRCYRYHLRAGIVDTVELMFIDTFYRRVPDEFYHYYMNISDVYVDIALSLEEEKEEEKKIVETREEETILPRFLYDDRYYNVLSNLTSKPYVSAYELSKITGISINTLWKHILPKLSKHGLVKGSRGYGYSITEKGIRALKIISRRRETAENEVGVEYA